MEKHFWLVNPMRKLKQSILCAILSSTLSALIAFLFFEKDVKKILFICIVSTILTFCLLYFIFGGRNDEK